MMMGMTGENMKLLIADSAVILTIFRHECHLLIPGTSKSEKYTNAEAFLLAKLLAK
jgi:hypothetical protein